MQKAVLGGVEQLRLEDRHHEQQQKDGHRNQRHVQLENCVAIPIKHAGNQAVGERDPDQPRDKIKRIVDILPVTGGEI